MSKISGGHSGGVTPVPIPNTEVKPASADGTWGVAPWESRSPPESIEGHAPPGIPVRGVVVRRPKYRPTASRRARSSRSAQSAVRPGSITRCPLLHRLVTAAPRGPEAALLAALPREKGAPARSADGSRQVGPQGLGHPNRSPRRVAIGGPGPHPLAACPVGERAPARAGIKARSPGPPGSEPDRPGAGLEANVPRDRPVGRRPLAPARVGPSPPDRGDQPQPAGPLPTERLLGRAGPLQVSGRVPIRPPTREAAAEPATASPDPTAPQREPVSHEAAARALAELAPPHTPPPAGEPPPPPPRPEGIGAASPGAAPASSGSRPPTGRRVCGGRPWPGLVNPPTGEA
jgi:hypothetical protein